MLSIVRPARELVIPRTRDMYDAVVSCGLRERSESYSTAKRTCSGDLGLMTVSRWVRILNPSDAYWAS